MEIALKLARCEGYKSLSSVCEDHYDNPDFWRCFMKALSKHNWLPTALEHRELYLTEGNEAAEKYLKKIISNCLNQ